MRVDLVDDPAVISIAARLDIDEDTIVGKLHRIWSWFDQHTVNGNASGVTATWVDRRCSLPGIAAAMIAVGWLVDGPNGLQLPNFERHNGETGKARALTAKRVAKSKAKGNADTVTNGNASPATSALPREEKNREEENRAEQTKTNTSPSTSSKPAQQPVRSSTGVPATWAEAAEAMKGLKISRRQEAIEAAKTNGFNPPQVLALIDYLLSPAAKSESPAGALCDRLGTPDAADWDVNEGWPWSRPVGSEPTSIYQPAADIERQRAELLEAERIESRRKFVQEQERCELAHGDDLNAMNDDQIADLIATDAPAVAKVLQREFRAKGRDSPDVRPALLKLIDRNKSKDIATD